MVGGGAGPTNGISDVGLRDPEFGELRPHGIGSVDAHGCQHDAAVVLRHVEVLRPAARRQNRLGQCQLVLGCELREHGQSVKQGCKEKLFP